MLLDNSGSCDSGAQLPVQHLSFQEGQIHRMHSDYRDADVHDDGDWSMVEWMVNGQMASCSISGAMLLSIWGRRTKPMSLRSHSSVATNSKRRHQPQPTSPTAR